MTIDARKLSSSAQEEKRRTAIKLYKLDHSVATIANILDVSDTAVRQWIKRWKAGGMKALKAKPQGHGGIGHRLTAHQSGHIRQLITDKYPDQLKLDYVLWTRQAVQTLIRQEYGLDLPVRTVGDYLARWGMTPQKPAKQAYEQSPAAVKQGLDETYPDIKQQAKVDNAEIYWCDETGLRNTTQYERGYAPKGKTPVVKLSAKRESINMISAITNQGKVRFQLYEGTMTADRFINFLKRLIKAADRKVYLILDNLRVHHAHIVRDWVADREDSIALFYLPSYSPELNPDDYLNCDLKAGVHRGKPARNKAALKKKTLSHMRMLQKRPSRVASYFRHAKIQYAA